MNILVSTSKMYMIIKFSRNGFQKVLNSQVANMNKNTRPRSSNSRSRSASWSLRPCRRPRVASAIDGGICSRSSVWPRSPLAAAAWAWAWAWSCWHVAYILNIVAIKKTPSTSQSYRQKSTENSINLFNNLKFHCIRKKLASLV